MKSAGAVALRKSEHQKCCKVQTELKGIGRKKYLTYALPRTMSPKFFHPFRATVSRFKDISHSRIFPLTAMLKFQSITKFLTLAQLPRKVKACIPP